MTNILLPSFFSAPQMNVVDFRNDIKLKHVIAFVTMIRNKFYLSE